VRVRLPIGESHKAVMVRERALVTDHREKGVYILQDRDKDGKPLTDGKDPKGNPILVRRPVWSPVGSPGVVRNGYVEIQKGVRPGDWVVVSGMQRLKTNDPDKVVKAEKYRASAPTGEGHASPESTALAPKPVREGAPLPE
jgi:multidrug efflux pump subunit AcrA (membrane-fusion protein)